MLVATLFQSDHDARQSCEEHVRIVGALVAGDLALARERMLAHIGSVESVLKTTARLPAADRLRAVLGGAGGTLGPAR